MSWSYETYMAQPTWFIRMLFEQLRAEAAHAKSTVQ